MNIDEGKLSLFRVENVKNPYIYEYKLVNNFPKPEGELIYTTPSQMIYQNGDCEVQYKGSMESGVEGAYLCVERREREVNVKVLENKIVEAITTKVILNSLGIEHLTAENNCVVLHSSHVKYNGKSILFTAPSGVGKSTQAELWKTLRNAKIINGDRTILKNNENEILAYGLPFSGSSKYCENDVNAVEAIVYLEQAEESEIRRLGKKEAFLRIWEGSNIPMWSKADVAYAFETVRVIVDKIPVFHLRCKPDESAVRVLETELRREW